MKVLIIDDSKVIFKMVGDIFKRRGHEAVWAENGAHAIEVINEHKYFDYIFLDWNMPVMSGIEFLQENKEKNFTSAPIIMMTTENRMEKMQEALALGAVEYITKPFDEHILFDKIQIVEDGF